MTPSTRISSNTCNDNDDGDGMQTPADEISGLLRSKTQKHSNLVRKKNILLRVFSVVVFVAVVLLTRTFLLATKERHNTIPPSTLGKWARAALKKNVNDITVNNLSVEKTNVFRDNNNPGNQRSIHIALDFLKKACPEFMDSNILKDDDRLVKAGRNVESLVVASTIIVNNDDNIHKQQQQQQDDKLNAGLELLVEEIRILASGKVKVPKVRFGKTNVQIPIITLGAMRFQQSWKNKITDMSQIDEDGQSNLLRILRYAIFDLGINHIETAKWYGTSELQLGQALQTLYKEEQGLQREDLIIQTKIATSPSVSKFRNDIEHSLKVLQTDYIDLFSLHCVSSEEEYNLLFENNDSATGTMMDVIRDYVTAGKIRHVGFSSHGRADFISKMIQTNAFEYANIHYHAFGSYTASGDGKYGGNLQNIQLMKEKDMGVFIISPFDKGGRLYAPSKKLRSITLPTLEPINYGALWLWSHAEQQQQNNSNTNAAANVPPDIHTIVNGAARPSDLDQAAVAAYMYGTDKRRMVQKVNTVNQRLREVAVKTFDEDWIDTWFYGVPNCSTDDDKIMFGQMVWMYNLVKTFGMLEFCKDRYANFESNTQRWNLTLTTPENIHNISSWYMMPGCEIDPQESYSMELADVPKEHLARVLDALSFVYKFCSHHSNNSKDISGNIPADWGTAYDMRPWAAFPERTGPSH